jgi:hypothetical protein
MKMSMYEASVPPMTRTLKNLSAILKKGAAHAKAKKIDPSVLVNARLAPDMYPLSRQVQIACDVAKFGAARLAEIKPPRNPDRESTFPELQARITKTLKFLRRAKRARIEGSDKRTIVLKFPRGTFKFKGSVYLTGWVLPNLYFHVTTAYAILRHNGVDVGKRDFLGKVR